MMQWPWDRAQPDEWLPRSLRLCWGDSGGGGWGDSGGGGWSGDSGGGWSGDSYSASTGGGDWSSAGTYDASGYNAGGDVSAYAGTAYDASTAGTGAGGGGDWGSFSATNYSGMNAPNPTFADVAGPNPGVTTGGGDWGSAGTFSAAGTGGGPGGAMSFASPGGGMYGNTGGGGLFGDYGGASPGGGGSYGGGGGKSSASFGEFGANFGGEGGGKSYAGSPTASPGWEPAAPSAGKGADPDAGPVGKSDAPTRSEAEVSSVPQADQDAPAAAPDADPDAGGKSDPDAGGKPDAGPDTSPSLSDGAPAGNIGGKDDAAPASQAAPEGGNVGAAAGVAGKGIGSDYAASPEGQNAAPSWGQSPAYQEASQQLSNLTQTALSGQDNWTGSPYANFGPDTNQAYTGPFAGPDVVGDRSSSYDGPFAGPDVVGDRSSSYDGPFAGPDVVGDRSGPYEGPFSGPDVVGDRSSPYDGPFSGPDVVGNRGPASWMDMVGPLISALPQSALWGTLPAWATRDQEVNAPQSAWWGTAPAWATRDQEVNAPQSALWGTAPVWSMRDQEVSAPQSGLWGTAPAWSTRDQPSLTNLNTWISSPPGWMQSLWGTAGNLLSPADNPADYGAYSGPFAGPDVVGDRSTGQDLASQLGIQSLNTYNGPFAGPDVVGDRSIGQDLASQLGTDQIGANQTPSEFAPGQPGMTTFEGEPVSSTGHTNFEGEPVSSTGHTNFEGEPVSSTGHTNFFEGETTPAIEAFIPGGRETDFANAAPGAIEAFIPGGRETDFAGSPAETAAQSAAAAAQQAGVSPEAAGAAASAAYAAAARGAGPAEQAEAAAAAAQQAGASPQQAMAIANSVYGQAQEGGGRPQSQGTTLGQVLDAVYGTGGPYTTPGGNVYGAHTVADIQAAVYGDNPPGVPTGNPNAPLSDDTSQGSYAATPGRASTFIPGGQVTNFEYAGSPAQQPQQAPPPSLVDMAQGAPQTSATIPGGRPTDFNYPTQARPAPAPAAPEPGEQDDAPENEPQLDPNTPRPPAPVLAPREPGGVTAADRAARGPNAQPEPQHVQDARQYLQGTANPGDTMNRQGPAVAIARLEPNFAVRLAAAVREARANGLPNASVFSAFRAPAFGANPGYAAVSQHGRGVAVDMSGIGRPGSREARLWYDIATRNGIFNPYGPNHRVEWNHYQAVPETGRQTANRLGPNPRNPPDNMVPTWDRVGVRPVAPPTQQVAGQANQAAVPTPRARPSDAPQPDVAQPRPPADIPPPAPPPTALPPQVPQETRPPADIPSLAPPRATGPNEFDIPVTPALRGQLDPVMIQRTIEAIQKEALRGINPNTTKEQAMAQGAKGRAALIAAGVPPAMAKAAMLDTGAKTAVLMGYGPGGKNATVMGFPIPQSMVQGKITEGVNEAMQGYNPAASGGVIGKSNAFGGPVQGPPSPTPDAPGKRSEAPFGGFIIPAAAGGPPASRPAIEPGQLPGRAEGQAPLPGGIAPIPDQGPIDPRSEEVFAPTRDRGIFDPDMLQWQQQEREQQQENLDPRGWQQAGLNLLNMFNPISTAEARSGRSQAGNLRAPQADPGTIQGRLSEARSNVISDIQTNQGLRNTLDLIVTGEVGSQGKAAVLAFLETAMNKVAAEASREGRAPTGRDLLQYLNDRSYFPQTWGKIESGKIKGGALTDDLLGAVGAGSNTTKGSTGNSSATSPGSRFGGNPTNATIGKEHYGVESYSHHAAWYNALGAPDMSAVGAMPPAPPALPAPNPLRGLAKGGHVDEDEPVVVGEEGPEFFIPDQPGTVVPHMPQPGKKTGNIDRWPKIPAPEYPGRFGGVEREMLRQTRAAQNPSPGLMEMIDSGRLRLNAANWQRMISDPDLIALGRSRMDDRRDGIDPSAEQFAAAPEPPTDPANPMAQALGYGSIKRRPMQIGRQIY